MSFATIFKNFEEMHLTKDVGMIPAAFSSVAQTNSHIIYWDRTQKVIEHQYGDSYMLVPMRATFFWLFLIKSFFYVLKNKINVVHLFHMKRETYFLCVAFWFVRKKVYLKMDMDSTQFPGLMNLLNSSGVKSFVLKFLLQFPYLISTENPSFYESLLQVNVIKNKIIYFPNSIYTPTVRWKPRPWEKRENRILVVGRLGAYQKNNELLLQALNKLETMNDWSLVLAGSMTSDFAELLNDFYRQKPMLKDKVQYVGLLKRDELFSFYASSKILLVTSRWEGLSLAMVEASFMGMGLLTTDIDGSDVLTKNGLFGKVIKNGSVGELLSALTDIFESDCFFDAEYEGRLRYFRDDFCLDKNINVLIGRVN